MSRQLMASSLELANASFALLIPQPCPVDLIRIGGDLDGAYLVPDDLDGIEACFSPGVNNFKRFEDELALRYGISCHMCDFSSDVEHFETELIPGFQTFIKKWLDIDGGENSISLEDWIDACASPGSDLILQIDIEGAEYRNLLAASESCIQRFRIIVIEMHGMSGLASFNGAQTPVEQLVKRLGESHTIVHVHPNNCCGYFLDRSTGMNIPNVLEITYLRKDRYCNSGSRLRRPEIPNLLDIPANVPHKPPLHLNANWNIECSQSHNSLQKIEQDRRSFEKIVQQRIHNESQQVKEVNLAINNIYSYLCASSNTLDNDLHGLISADDVAAGKPFHVSSNYLGSSLQGIISAKSPFFFHTCIEDHPRITIDFCQSFLLGQLIIKNRSDSFQERAQFLLYSVHDNPSHQSSPVYPVNVSTSFLLPNGKKSITPLLGQKGRYLTLFSPSITALHFSDLKVIRKH